ncbi:MAG TPA: HAD family hydrolase [Longimicrobiales bacterium]|nr:HAD family hydrolase [Longimicrobiales bacterium]
MRAAVFVDRDGTVVVERSYLADPEGVELVPGAASALADLACAGFALVLVTNQSGIALGLYDERAYRAVTERLVELLAREGVRLDAIEHCPHHPSVTGPCACRKPGTGMHTRAAAALGLDPSRSWFVGDKITDVLPALELGGRAILVRTGYGREHEPDVPAGVAVADDLRAAADRIFAAGGASGTR